MEGWGSRVAEKISRDIQNAFPGISGFSKTNIDRMKAFYRAYAISPQLVGKLEKLPIFSIPWGHNIAIFERVKDSNQRIWYANMVIEEGWSRNALLESIKTESYKRYGRAITNFHEHLPSLQSQLAQETLKDPYNFDFLELTKEHAEKDLENGLLGSPKHVMLGL